MKGIIAALSPEGVIGLDGKMPWHYPADLRYFKHRTWGSTVIMGRLTWTSLGAKPLAGRRNIVISSSPLFGVETHPDLPSALKTAGDNVWFIGGARIYAEAMAHADFLDLTYVPDHVDAPHAVRFPNIDLALWVPGPLTVHPDDARLSQRIYRRREAVG